MNVVLLSSRGSIQIWLYPEKASKKLRSRQPDALSTKASMLGRDENRIVKNKAIQA